MRRGAKALLAMMALVPALAVLQHAQPAAAATTEAEFSIEGKGAFATGLGNLTIGQPTNALNVDPTRTDRHWVLVPFTINDGAGFRESNVVVAVSDTQVLSNNIGVWQENAVGLRPGVPGIRFDSCETENGRFIVDQFAQQATAPYLITKLVVRFEHHCNGTVIGSIAWNADDGLATSYAAHRVTGGGFAGGAVDFGTVTYPATSARQLTLTNTGTRTLTIRLINLSGFGVDDFALTHNCTTLGQGASCTINVTAQPLVSGPTDATIRIYDEFTGIDDNQLKGAGEAITLHAVGANGPNGRVELDGESGNIIADGKRVVKSGTFSGSATGISISGSSINMSISVPGGMVPDGSYTIGGDATMTMATLGPTVACASPAGSLHVIETAPGAHFVARFKVTCGTDRAVVGQITFSPTGAVISRLVSPGGAVVWPNPVNVGQSSAPQSISVTNQGTGTTVVDARLTKGLPAGDVAQFSVLSNSCTSAALAPGKSCAIVVAFTPIAGGGNPVAAVSIRDTFSDNKDRRVFLQGVGGSGSGGYPWNVDGEFMPLPPTRILDTRIDPSFRTFVEPLHGGEPRFVDVAGKGGVPTDGVSAAVLNVTVDAPTTSAYLTIYPTSGSNPPPTASNLNFVAGQTVPNLVVAQLGDGGRVNLYTNAGDVHVIIDVVGWITSDTGTARGSRLQPVAPTRILDTRTGTGGRNVALGTNDTMYLQVADPLDGYTAAVINLTGTDTSASTYVTAYPSGLATRPTASNLNLVRGQTRPNLVMVQLGADGGINLYNFNGQVNLVADLVGLFKPGGSRDTQTGRIKPFAPVRIVYTPSGGAAAKIDGGTVQTWDLGAQSAAVGLGGMGPGLNTGFIANFTATEGNSSTYMTVYPSDQARPTASNLNVLPNENVPNLAVISLSAANQFSVFNNSGAIHYIFDAVARIAA